MPPDPRPPSYRERLRIEGATLALLGLVGTAAVFVAHPEAAARQPLNTVAQLAAVTGLLAFAGPRVTRRALRQATPLEAGEEGTGEPTPLWHLPLVVAGLTAVVVIPSGVIDRAGWDAGVRVTLGCALVGLAQAGVLARIVAADERARGRRYVRLRGSRILRGTRLGWRPA